jgi:Na+:H+ antiporter, NhaA family
MGEGRDKREIGHFRQPWVRSDRPVPRLVVRPVERFLQHEAGSALLLMVAALAALIWANAASDSYESAWSTLISFEVGGFVVAEDLRHVVNELLMAVFFYVVALEVKREIRSGSLRRVSSAAVPVAAALGTMVGGALTYVAVNTIGAGDLRGWAIPVATDIAFAVGALGLVGGSAPRELRAFMLTLAVVDDIGTIVVIGVAFSQDISYVWLSGAGVCLVLVALSQRIGIRLLLPYVLLAGLLWLAVFKSGIHATIAGVVLGFLTPGVPFHSRRSTAEALGDRLTELAESDTEIGEATLLEAARFSEEAVSPLGRMLERLHPWTAYGILPLFALANAGLAFSFDRLADALTGPIGLGIVLGLVVGAPVGGVLCAWGIVRFGGGRLPPGLDWPAVAGVSPLKGIGFTIAIFISALAFEEQALQEEAKLAILFGSALAATIGVTLLLLRHTVVRRRAPRPDEL